MLLALSTTLFLSLCIHIPILSLITSCWGQQGTWGFHDFWAAAGVFAVSTFLAQGSWNSTTERKSCPKVVSTWLCLGSVMNWSPRLWLQLCSKQLTHVVNRHCLRWAHVQDPCARKVETVKPPAAAGKSYKPQVPCCPRQEAGKERISTSVVEFLTTVWVSC